ncbi:MAG: AAA family ATPase [Patescibacteria group bacterium]
MKIRSIKISNILSFEYKDDIDLCESIVFNKNVNILIGPNGVGKSNFLEIINQIFKRILFKQPDFDFDTISKHENNPADTSLNQTLDLTRRSVSHLKKNKYSSSKIKKIKIEILLNDNDVSNLKFIHSNADKINDILNKYSRIKLNFDGKIIFDDIEKIKSLTLILEDKEDTNIFSISELSGSTAGTFITKYFEYFEFVQKIIFIANEREGESWSELKTSFVLIGCYRNYNSFSNSYSLSGYLVNAIRDVENKRKEENTKSADVAEPLVFEMVKKILSYRHSQLLFSEQLNAEGVSKKIKEEPLLTNINNLLKQLPLQLELNIVKKNPHDIVHQIFFIDLRDQKRIEVEELSAGQKSVLHFFFSIFGYDLSNGLLIIDEPELHLHPQIQEQYMLLIEKVALDNDMQFILATHSPIFVSRETINNVFRFSKATHFTHVSHPPIAASDQELVRILNYTNSSKIFFSKKVVLVEGESDEFFYRRFYEHLQKQNRGDDNIEFLAIKGKGAKELWFDFLQKFDVMTFFIGDWDNIIESGLLSNSELEKYKNNFRQQAFKGIDSGVFLQKNSKDRIILLENLKKYLEKNDPNLLSSLRDLIDYLTIRHLPCREIVEFINLNDRSTLASLNVQIESLYAQNRYYLKRGELEDYLGLRTKSLQDVIYFIENDFNSWLANTSFKSEVEEITQIFSDIIRK